MKDTDIIMLGSDRHISCYRYIANIFGFKEGDKVPYQMQRSRILYDLNRSYGRNCVYENPNFIDIYGGYDDKKGCIAEDVQPKDSFNIDEPCLSCASNQKTISYQSKLKSHPELAMWYVDCIQGCCYIDSVGMVTYKELSRYYDVPPPTHQPTLMEKILLKLGLSGKKLTKSDKL